MPPKRLPPPPPPQKRRRSRAAKRPPPPPPPPKSVTRKPCNAVPRVIEPPPALRSAHVRRVTLNLIRHASAEVCPPDLAAALNRLADQCDWDMAGLSREDLELIFALVDEETANRAAAQFWADTQTIIDHRASTGVCELCGQPHIRWEFTIRNGDGGRSIQCGSSCIVTYGLSVDGEAAGEAALAKLKAAIGKLKKVAARDAWTAAHPDHRQVMETVAVAQLWYGKRLNPWQLYRFLGLNWRSRVIKQIRSIRAVLKYYRKNGYLTPTKTSAVWSDQGILVTLTRLHAEYQAAEVKADAARRAPVGSRSPMTTPAAKPAASSLPKIDSDESDLPF